MTRPAATDQSRVREEWSKLAPYLSMNNELTLVDVNLTSIAGAFQRVAQLADLTFDSHPDLAKVGPPYIRYLIASESRVVPAIRARLTPQDALENPEEALGAVFIELFSRAMEDRLLRSWQIECDLNARSAYQALLPMVRSLAAQPQPAQKSGCTVASNGGYGLVARNDSDLLLTNVTIIIDLKTLDGRSAWHFFYLASWEPQGEVQLRPAGDWMDVGLQCTTGGTVEMLADQRSYARATFEIPEHVPRTVRSLLAWLAPRDGYLALKGLNAAKPRARGDLELNKQIEDLRKIAQESRRQEMDSLRERISRLELSLKAPPPSRFGRGAKLSPEESLANRKRVNDQIAPLRQRLSLLTTMK